MVVLGNKNRRTWSVRIGRLRNNGVDYILGDHPHDVLVMQLILLF